MVELNVESVAVIGCGPAGIAALYELLHTDENGVSSAYKTAENNCKFKKIVGFEQKEKAGGIWYPSFDKSDLPLPPQKILDTEIYNNPSVINPSHNPPENLKNSDVSNPVKANIDPELSELQWKRSGIFSDLYTNIPARFTRFSYMENDQKYYDKEKRIIYPFMTNQELCSRIEDFIDDEHLNDYIRFNSNVQSVKKNPSTGKWTLTIKHTNDHENVDEWYQEEFDAVVLASGHYTIPNYPHVPGLSSFNKTFPNSISHANAYRSHNEFKDQRILVIGGSTSTINVLQYIVPVAESVTVSSRGKNIMFPWMNKAIRSEGINHKTTIKEIKANGDVLFTDGTLEPKFDKIVFTTGYHLHFPYMENDSFYIKRNNSGAVRGLYYHTFSMEDPTLACIGITSSTLALHTMEMSAAAIAGVWSGASKLPSKEKQLEWETFRQQEQCVNGLFEYYYYDLVKDHYFDALQPLVPKGRKNPLHIDGDYVEDIDIGFKSVEALFYKVKSGELTIEQTMNPDIA